MIWLGLVALSALASLFAWCLVRINKGENYEVYDKLEATMAPGEPVRGWFWDLLGLLCAVMLAAWALYSIMSDAHGQTMPTPIQPQERPPYIEQQGPPKPQAKPQPHPQRRVERQAPVQVECWEVPNGAARTIACANGYWITTMPDGTVVTGMGINDPNAALAGSVLLIDPRTGGPVVGGQNVQAPNGTIPTPGPGQWWYGHPAPQ